MVQQLDPLQMEVLVEKISSAVIDTLELRFQLLEEKLLDKLSAVAPEQRRRPRAAPLPQSSAVGAALLPQSSTDTAQTEVLVADAAATAPTESSADIAAPPPPDGPWVSVALELARDAIVEVEGKLPQSASCASEKLLAARTALVVPGLLEDYADAYYKVREVQQFVDDAGIRIGANAKNPVLGAALTVREVLTLHFCLAARDASRDAFESVVRVAFRFRGVDSSLISQLHNSRHFITTLAKDRAAWDLAVPKIYGQALTITESDTESSRWVCIVERRTVMFAAYTAAANNAGPSVRKTSGRSKGPRTPKPDSGVWQQAPLRVVLEEDEPVQAAWIAASHAAWTPSSPSQASQQSRSSGYR